MVEPIRPPVHSRPPSFVARFLLYQRNIEKLNKDRGALGQQIREPVAELFAARSSALSVSRWEHIAGLTVVNDVSARDVQLSAMRAGTIHDVETLARAKSFPTFKPLGPAVLMADDLAEQPDLLLQTFVNGQLRQQGRTSEMLFDLAEIVAYVSSRVDLRAGDVLLTGTPSGVGLANGHYLTAGDRVEVRVEGIGSLRNTVVA